MQKDCSLKVDSFLTLSHLRPISYKNQSIDLLCKSMDWFLYDIGLRRERVNYAFVSKISLSHSTEVFHTNLSQLLNRTIRWMSFFRSLETKSLWVFADGRSPKAALAITPAKWPCIRKAVILIFVVMLSYSFQIQCQVKSNKKMNSPATQVADRGFLQFWGQINSYC